MAYQLTTTKPHTKLKTEGFDPVTLLSLTPPLPQPTPGTTVLYTPMAHFCAKGDLGMCRYLYYARRVDCTERSGFSGTFPMHEAAYNGHLDLCKWMYKHGGAREDIRGTLGSGTSLLRVLLEKPQDERNEETWKWFIMKGALWGENDDSGRLDEIMRREIPVSTFLARDIRPHLLEWVQNKIQIHNNYLRGFLGGVALCNRMLSQNLSPLQVLSGKADTGIKALIADYAGVLRGRELRMFRHFADHLSAFIQEESVQDDAEEASY